MSFLLLGIDSLIACVAICSIVERRWRLPVAALFGVADGVVFLIGASLGWRLSEGVTGVLETGMLAALGLWLLLIAAGVRRAAALWPVWALPWVLTLDNLAFGLVGDLSAGSLLQQAGVQASSSTLLALVGLLVAVRLPRVFPVLERRAVAYRVAGGALLLTAGGLAVLG